MTIPEDTVTLVRINAAAQLARGRRAGPRPRPAPVQRRARRLAGAHHGRRPRVLERDRPGGQGQQQMIHFFKNLSMLGGLMLAAVDTEGQPGRRLARPARRQTARREAKHLAREAKLQAKLAAKSARPRSLERVEPRPLTSSGPPRRARGPSTPRVALPGSKSLTNRALVLAALSDGPVRRTPGPALARHRADGGGPDHPGVGRGHLAATTGRSPPAPCAAARSTAAWPAP